MKFKINKRYFISLCMILIVIVGSVYLIREVKASPIKDELLRDDVVRELDLEESKYDYTRTTKEDIGQLTELVNHYEMIRYYERKTLDKLEYATDLEVIIVNANEIKSVRPLEDLTKLHTLDLSYFKGDHTHAFGAPERRIKDIQPLEKLMNLKELHLSGNS